MNRASNLSAMRSWSILRCFSGMTPPTKELSQILPVKGLSVFSQNARPIGRDPVQALTKDEIDKAHSYVLSNCDEVRPYFVKYRGELKVGSDDNLSGRQQKNFAQWFKQHMMTLRHKESKEATNELFSLACGAHSMKSYPCCIINGVCFWVRRDKRHKAPNPGLHVLKENEDEVIELFGYPTNVIELVYKLGHRVVLFSCEWLNTNSKQNFIQKECNLVNICVSFKWYEGDPFVLADSAKQVFYLDDQKWRPNWRLVQGLQDTVLLNIKPIYDSKNESNKDLATLAQIPDNISDSEHERISTEPQHSTSMSSTPPSHRATREEQSSELVRTLETELENERALTASQKAELESRRALTQVQKAELESERALTLTQKVERESQRALTLSQKAELESQRALSQHQQTELESQRLLTQCQQAELESTRRVVQGQNQLLQDQQQLFKDQLERLKHFEDLVMNLHKSSDQSGICFGTPGIDLSETIARMSTYKRKKV